MRRWFLVFALLLLTVLSSSAGTYQRTKDGKTLVWNNDPAPNDEATWSGERDSSGYATGPGTVTWTRGTRFIVTGSNIPVPPRDVRLISRCSGTMTGGKFDGTVVIVDAHGRTFHGTFVDGSRTGDWSPGPAPAPSKKKAHPTEAIAAAKRAEEPKANPVDRPDEEKSNATAAESPHPAKPEPTESGALAAFRPPSSLGSHAAEVSSSATASPASSPSPSATASTVPSPSSSPAPSAADKNGLSRTADVDGVQLHYTMAGHGPAVLLLHGYAETSRMWKPIIPLLAEHFTVIAPDLPGIGDSSIPPNGLDMKTAAARIHSLVRSLKIEKARVVGHDIGLMVAYAYAAQFPNEVEKLVVMDAFLPGIGEWESIYNNPAYWHFRFNGATPEALVEGRERAYFEHYWNDFAADKAHSIPEADRVVYTEAYARPGRMRAGWAYFVSFTQAARDFAQLSRTKLTMPVLAIGGDKALGNELSQQMKLVALDVKSVILKDTGHWLMEERPKETTDALLKFL